MNIVITRSQGDLHQERWEFSFLLDGLAGARGTPLLVVNEYRQQERQSKRHKFRNSVWYHRHKTRGSSIAVADVPLPDDVKQQALATYVSRIVVCKDLT